MSRRSRRSKRRAGSAPMPSSGAGLIRFFEDSSIGVKISPTAAVIFAASLIVIVILAHLGIFEWLLSPI